MSCVILCTGGNHSRRLRYTYKQILSLCLIVPVMKTTGLEPPVIHHVRSVLYDRLRRLHGMRRCHGTRSRTNAPAEQLCASAPSNTRCHYRQWSAGRPTEPDQSGLLFIFHFVSFVRRSAPDARIRVSVQPSLFPRIPRSYAYVTLPQRHLLRTSSLTAERPWQCTAERCGGLSI